MARLLGIDFGERRIGLALSDPSATIASPLRTLPRRTGKRPPVAELLRIMDEYDVSEIVVGLPLTLAGDDSEWTGTVRAFAAQLGERAARPVHLIDERFTSVVAEHAVRNSGLRKRDREDKARVDEAAAALILQSYLNTHSREREE